MEKRKEMIKQQLFNAEETNKKALAVKEQYETEMKTAKETVENIINMGKETAIEQQEHIIKEAKEQADHIIKEAEKTISIEREKAIREMESEIAGLAMAATAKILGDTSNDSENYNFYDQFLVKAGEGNDTNSN